VYLCSCKGWKESDVQHLAASGIGTGEQLAAYLGLEDEDACGICLLRLDEFEAIIARCIAGGEAFPESLPPGGARMKRRK